MSHDCVILSAAKNLDCYAGLCNQALVLGFVCPLLILFTGENIIEDLLQPVYGLPGKHSGRHVAPFVIEA